MTTYSHSNDGEGERSADGVKEGRIDKDEDAVFSKKKKKKGNEKGVNIKERT